MMHYIRGDLLASLVLKGLQSILRRVPQQYYDVSLGCLASMVHHDIVVTALVVTDNLLLHLQSATMDNRKLKTELPILYRTLPPHATVDHPLSAHM